MNKSLLLAAIVATVALAACGKKEEAPMAPAPVAAPAAAVVEAASAVVSAASAVVEAASAAMPAASK